MEGARIRTLASERGSPLRASSTRPVSGAPGSAKAWLESAITSVAATIGRAGRSFIDSTVLSKIIEPRSEGTRHSTEGRAVTVSLRWHDPDQVFRVCSQAGFLPATPNG